MCKHYHGLLLWSQRPCALVKSLVIVWLLEEIFELWGNTSHSLDGNIGNRSMKWSSDGCSEALRDVSFEVMRERCGPHQ